MRRGVLSDDSIKRMYPEYFPPDFRTHQVMYEDGVDVPKHTLTGIKRPKTAHQHLKTKPIYPLIANSIKARGSTRAMARTSPY